MAKTATSGRSSRHPSKSGVSLTRGMIPELKRTKYAATHMARASPRSQMKNQTHNGWLMRLIMAPSLEADRIPSLGQTGQFAGFAHDLVTRQDGKCQGVYRLPLKRSCGDPDQ